MNDEAYILSQYRAAIKLIDAQRKLMVDAKADSEIMETMSAIIRHLHGISESQILKIIGGRRHRDNIRSRKDDDAVAASTMSLEAVESAVSDEKTTRARLEAIAVGRFQVPRGSLRSLGNIDQLRDKLSTLSRNERAHETISSVAKDTRV